MITQQLKKKRSKNPVCSYLRKLISPYGFGWKGDDGVGRYSNETLIRMALGLGATSYGLMSYELLFFNTDHHM